MPPLGRSRPSWSSSFRGQSARASARGLARSAERSFSNVHTDVARIEELGLIEGTEEDAVFVPYESVEILLPLAQVACAPTVGPVSTRTLRPRIQTAEAPRQSCYPVCDLGEPVSLGRKPRWVF